jgi:hypothetical protein
MAVIELIVACMQSTGWDRILGRMQIILGCWVVFAVGPGLGPCAAELTDLLSEATSKAEWLEQRQQFEWRGDPYGLTGMPVTVLNAQRRWTYGGRLHLANYSAVPFSYCF